MVVTKTANKSLEQAGADQVFERELGLFSGAPCPAAQLSRYAKEHIFQE
jgi:hypothetical protein